VPMHKMLQHINGGRADGVPGWIGWRQKAGINDAAPDGRSLGVSYGQIA
jgi:hypothetical protein